MQHRCSSTINTLLLFQRFAWRPRAVFLWLTNPADAAGSFCSDFSAAAVQACLKHFRCCRNLNKHPSVIRPFIFLLWAHLKPPTATEAADRQQTAEAPVQQSPPTSDVNTTLNPDVNISDQQWLHRTRVYLYSYVSQEMSLPPLLWSLMELLHQTIMNADCWIISYPDTQNIHVWNK